MSEDDLKDADHETKPIRAVKAVQGVILEGVIVTVCVVIVGAWLILGAVAGFKAPYSFAGFVFEEAYAPEPNFFANLNTLANMIVGAWLARMGYRSVGGQGQNGEQKK